VYEVLLDQNEGQFVGNLRFYEYAVCNDRITSDVVDFLPHVE